MAKWYGLRQRAMASASPARHTPWGRRPVRRLQRAATSALWLNRTGLPGSNPASRIHPAMTDSLTECRCALAGVGRLQWMHRCHTRRSRHGQLATITPPGRTTRPISRTAAAGSSRCSNTSLTTAARRQASGSGRAYRSPASSRAPRTSAGRTPRARTQLRHAMSSPSGRSPRSAIMASNCPPPMPRSATASPPAGPPRAASSPASRSSSSARRRSICPSSDSGDGAYSYSSASRA